MAFWKRLTVLIANLQIPTCNAIIYGKMRVHLSKIMC